MEKCKSRAFDRVRATPVKSKSSRASHASQNKSRWAEPTIWTREQNRMRHESCSAIQTAREADTGKRFTRNHATARTGPKSRIENLTGSSQNPAICCRNKARLSSRVFQMIAAFSVLAHTDPETQKVAESWALFVKKFDRVRLSALKEN